ncbi:hypothetical protein [Nocardia sp. NPDC057030]|uniref:hypothetical protein n=1 Tax=unclassified Nocardia TaxID=2637762 RepID=UPI00362F8C21
MTTQRATALTRADADGWDYHGSGVQGRFLHEDGGQIDVSWTLSGVVSYAKRWDAAPGSDAVIRFREKDKLARLLAWFALGRS